MTSSVGRLDVGLEKFRVGGDHRVDEVGEVWVGGSSCYMVSCAWHGSCGSLKESTSGKVRSDGLARL